MKRKGILVALALSLVIAAFGLWPASNQAQRNVPSACGIDVSPALMALANRSFPAKYFSFMTVEMLRKNDENCSGNEKMLNVIIVLQGITGGISTTYYGIYHIHFNGAGKLLSATAYTPWQPLYNSLAPAYNDWCEFIEAFYPQNDDDQGCY